MATDNDEVNNRIAQIESEIAEALSHNSESGIDEVISTIGRLRQHGVGRSKYNLASLYSRQTNDTGGVLKPLPSSTRRLG